VNGDKVDDLLVGAVSNTGWIRSAVYVVFGGGDFLPVEAIGDLHATGRAVKLEEIPGSAIGTGFALEPLGDVNADGLADFLVSAPGATNQTGDVYLIYGQRSLP